jgi:hypothetical protein
MTTIRVKTTVDVSRIAGAARQVPFAMSLALNETAKLAQLRVQQSLDTRFTINPSRKEFFRRLIKIPRGGFATKTNLRVELDITGPTNAPGRNALLKRHVDGGLFTKDDPLNPFFIPSKTLRPGAYDLPPRALYPKALRLQEQQGVSGTLASTARTTKRGKTVIVSQRGNRKTAQRAGMTFFVVPFDNPLGRTPGIYVRKKGEDNIHLLWLYKKRISIKPRLPFENDVRTVFDAQFDKQFVRALERAMATAKK